MAPYTIQGEPNTTSNIANLSGKYDYDYPDGLDFRPATELHKDVVKRVLDMARASQAYMSRRYKAWNEIDRVLTAFMPLDDDELRSKSKDSRKPVSIVFPHTHAILESLLSYMVSAFFQDPIFSYKGHGPEDVVGSILMTKAVSLHCDKTKVPLALHTMFRDAFAYGLGITVPTWKTQYATVFRPEPRGFLNFAGIFKQESIARVSREELVFEGNALINIDPYKALLDPNTPIQKFQESEFFGWVENTNYMTLLGEERNSSDLFNVKYLQHMKNARTSILSKDESDRDTRIGGTRVDDGITPSTNPTDVIHMYANIVPKEWKLGPSEYPEKWYFQIAGDNLVIQAKPLNLGHGMYPAAVCAPDYDGYSTAPVARLEMLFGLQGTLDWLFNVHIKNVRKAINDMFVYDPYLINSKDLENPKDGWLIRTRRPAWGKGVKDAISQLNVNDVTRQNIADSGFLVQWMQKIGGVDDSMSGTLRQGGPERLTGAEFQGTRQAGMARLERMAKIIGWQAMQDIGFFFASHTQQLMTEESYVPVLGQWETLLQQEYANQIQRGRMKVKPTDLLVNYDVVVRDGSLPGGNYSPVWEKMFTVIAEIPELQQQFDLTKIFKHIARNNGANNVEEFVKVQVMPDQQVLDQVQQGNLKPFGREVA
jgi:hypothetical protein